MKYFVYILECSDKTLYTGITKDLKKRLLGTGEWKVKDVSLVGGYVNKLTLDNGLSQRKIYYCKFQ